MAVIARLPGCAGQQRTSQNRRCIIFIENSKVRMSRYLDTSTKTQMFKINGPAWKTQSFLLSETVRSSIDRTLIGKAIRESSIRTLLGKCSKLGMLICKPRRRTISVCVCGRYKTGKKQNLDPMWKVLNKEVDLDEPTSFLDHVHLGCTQRECETSKDIADNCRNMFESRISAGVKEKLPCSGKLDADISSQSYDMESHAKKCVERFCELSNKTTQQLYKVSTPCIDDHHFKEEELGSVGELSQECSQIVLKCQYLARIGKPDIPWSVNTLARAVVKWTRQSLWQTLGSFDFSHSHK